MPSETFCVRLGERSFEFEWDGKTLRQDGVDLSISLARTAPGHYSLLADGRSLALTVEGRENGVMRLRTSQKAVDLRVLDRRARLLESIGGGEAASTRREAIKAPMPGLIVKVLVKPGDPVEKGDGLIVLEAMKMENEIRASHAGIVAAVHVEEGTAVGKNDLLIEYGEA